MNKDIRNLDKNGTAHGKQIWYYANDNINWISNYHHGKVHGYRAWFKSDKSINIKTYWNMDKSVYSENHLGSKQIEIRI